MEHCQRFSMTELSGFGFFFRLWRRLNRERPLILEGGEKRCVLKPTEDLNANRSALRIGDRRKWGAYL